ncbi:MAG: site-specific integrase [Clostridiales bacterium]|nr:site-specific integrase [Clostridiales bacterium]
MAKRLDSNRRTLRKGESQNADGRYRYQVTVDGKPHTLYSWPLCEGDKTPPGKKPGLSLRELEEKFERDIRDGICVDMQRMTLNQLFTRYMKTKTNLRSSTEAQYQRLWRIHIHDVIGDRKVKDFKRSDVKILYAGFQQKNGLSYKTISLINCMLNPVFEMAVDDDIIRKNPCKDALKDLEDDRTTKDALTIAEENELLSFVKNSPVYCVYFPLLVFMFNTGLRAGEVLGLRRGNIQKNDTPKQKAHIKVRMQLSYDNCDGQGSRFRYVPLKTKGSVRDIPLTPVMIEALEEQERLDRISGKQKQAVCGYRDYIFTNSKGKPYRTSDLNEILNNIVRAHNKNSDVSLMIPRVSCHTTRHSFCTRAAESGVDLKTLQYLMGHSNASTTMEVYNHVDCVRVENEIEKMNTAINF